jgi:uncharacterized damage-inducible protein DinB
MSIDTTLRTHLKRLLAWEDAHAGLEAVVSGFPAAHRGTQPKGLPYSAWQLLEHLRITQHDILDFCVNPDYEEMEWPRDYWPAGAEPPSPDAWDDSIRAFLADRAALQALAADATIDLASRIPHGKDQTYLRELLLVADHSAYHIGQLVLVRRLLGDWP